MGMDLNTKLRKFHQAKWDEPIIFELSRPGERGVLMPTADPGIEEAVGDGISSLPSNMVRKDPPALPELGQMQVLKHFLRLSQENLGADLNVDIGQGTCTMKYSPKINEQFATAPKFTEVHPLQPEESVQGILQIIHELDLFLREISGLDRFSFQPGGGSHAILGMASMVRAYHETNGEGDQRDEIITTIFSHPSDYSAASVLGYKVINLYPDADGMPDLDALKAAVSERTAALFITNPEDTGIYNARIVEFTQAVHEAGGLCGYDQANANGILGITRAKEAGFDLCFFNLHKTFSSPHGCGGPGSGALGATESLRPLLRSSQHHREDQELLRRHARCGQSLVLDQGAWRRRPGGSGSGGGAQQQLSLQEGHGDPGSQRTLCRGSAPDRAGTLQLGEALRGDGSGDLGHHLSPGRLRDAHVVQPSPLCRPGADDAGADGIVLQSRARRVHRCPRASVERGVREPGVGEDSPPPKRDPAPWPRHPR